MKFKIKYFVLLILFFLNISYSENLKEHKFLLSLYHYNIQYVAGGGTKIEDRIITESLEPLLDLYLAHPNWGGSFEMQGYLIEVLSARHPKVLEKLRKLVNSGQIELVCFHYSDQLFLAYPRECMNWSEKLNQEIFKKYNLKRSGVVFTQEGQFGEGMLDFMRENNYNIAIMPHNLYKYLHTELDKYPYYELRGVYVILTSAEFSDTENKINMRFSYFGDAELLPTDGKNPYFKSFRKKEEAIKKYEEKLEEAEKEGWKISTCSSYIETLKKLNIKPKKLRPVLDGTWQPDDTKNFFLWMGGKAQTGEMDNFIRSFNYKTYQNILAVEALIEFAKKKNIDVEKEESLLKEAIRHLLFSQVSDSTGWFPHPCEIQYSIDEGNFAEEILSEIVQNLKNKLKIEKFLIDTKKREVKKYFEEKKNYIEVEPPIKFEIRAENIKYSLKCYKISEIRYDLEINFIPEKDSKTVSVIFPLNMQKIVYSPGLLEKEIVEYPFYSFDFNYIHLPLSNGLIGLSNNLFLIKHNSFNHISCKIDKQTQTVEFTDDTILSSPFTFKFSLIFADKVKAREEAEKINVYPELVL
jgi:hypothetical protein